MNDAFDIEELLRENLLNKSKLPPVELFQEIEQRLIRKKRRRRLFWILFWIGLGIGAYFIGDYFVSIFNTECDCPTPQSDEIVIKTKKIIKPVSQETTYSTITDLKNEVHENEIYSVDVALKSMNPALSLENQIIKKSGSDASDIPNTVTMQPEREREPEKLKVELSESFNDSKIKPEVTESLVKQINNSGSLMASIVESTVAILSTKPSEQIILKEEKLLQDEVPIVSETKNESQKQGLTFYAGPSLFDIAVFKPYLSSGSLSKRPFKSSGYELGIGSFRQLNERWRVNLSIAYNRKQSQFLYDLLVSQEDYFNYYENDVLISVEQLDQEESCNCFVANDVQLEYAVNTINFSIGTSYQLAEFKKFDIYGNFNLLTNIFTQFKNNSNSVVNFPSQKTEKLNSLGLKSGFAIGYALTKNTRLTLSPNYTYLFTRSQSSFYARSLKEINVSVGMTFSF